MSVVKAALPISSIIIAVSASYLALTLSFSGFGALAWIAPPFLFLSLRDASPPRAAIVAGIYSLLSWLFSAWWLALGINAMNDSYLWAGPAALIALAVISASPYAVGAFLAARFKFLQSKSPHPLAAAAVLVTTIELWPAKFPGVLAHALFRDPTMTQIVELGGVPMLQFALHATGFAACCIGIKNLSRNRRLSMLLIAVVIPVCTYCYGTLRISTLTDELLASKDSLTVAMIQPNMPIKSSAEAAQDNTPPVTIIEQTMRVLQQQPAPNLVVWPEIPIFFAPDNVPLHKQALDNLLKDRESRLLANVDLYPNELVNGRVRFFNSVQLFHGNGSSQGSYRKMILVPFGEYLPFESWLSGPTLGKIMANSRRYSAGDTLTLLEPYENIKVGTPICLEAQHTGHLSSMVRAGANIIVNPANDAYFGNTAGAQIDLALVALHAIEFRIPIVRITNSGISASIDQRGIIDPHSIMPQFSAAERIVRVIPSSQHWWLSPHQLGTIFLFAVAAIGLIGRKRFN